MMHPYLKTFLAVCAITVLLAGAVHAQNYRDRGDRFRGPPDAEQRVAHLSRMLELTDEQSVRLLEVFQAADEEREVLHQMALEQMKPQICALRLGVEAEMQQILTDEQLAGLDQIKEDRGPGRRNRRGPGAEDMDCSGYQQDGS